MTSPQTLSDEDRRLVATWAADCAERVLPVFETERPGDTRPRAAIARARAFAAGDADVAEAIRRRFADRVEPGEASPAATAAARAAGQAAAVVHMGAHALGAAAYAAKAAALAAPDAADVVHREVAWQLGHASPEVSAALHRLPPLGQDRSGPLGPGLLASGVLGEVVRALQDGLRPRGVTDPPR